MADNEILLRQRGKQVGPGLRKIACGLAAVALLPVTLAFVPHRMPLALLFIVSAVAVGYGGWWLVDGGTDLYVWYRLGRGPRSAMRLSPRGVEYSAGFRGQFDLSVPWSEVTGSMFRPGIGGTPVFCIDVADRFPSPPGRFGCDPQPSEEAVTRLALAWAAMLRPLPEYSPAELAMMYNLYRFGTPLVINLARCDGADPAEMDRSLAAWTQGRCRCLPPLAGLPA